MISSFAQSSFQFHLLFHAYPNCLHTCLATYTSPCTTFQKSILQALSINSGKLEDAIPESYMFHLQEPE